MDEKEGLDKSPSFLYYITMKTKDYAFVEFETGVKNWFGEGNIREIGYVTESILKSDKNRNKRVRVHLMNVNPTFRYPRRKNIITIIPLYCLPSE